jgi:7-cyano-7-deazaguanine synthase in queuosine biosynthesis
MKAIINLEINDPHKKGEFDNIIMHLTKGDKVFSKNINFEFNSLHTFAKDTSSEAFDLLLLSVVVYNVDRFVNRHIFSLEGWTRDIEIRNMPVNNKISFDKVKNKIDNALSFLTGDIWNINYTHFDSFLFKPSKKQYNFGPRTSYKKVSLFSGGLDSLIGAIDELDNCKNGKILFVSHKELGKEGKDQDRLKVPLSLVPTYSNKFEMIQSSVGIGKKEYGDEISKESTFRARSFLFIGMGIYLAHCISPSTELIIPENGTIALNIPLLPSRRSACSTRTTHPTFLKKLQTILRELGISNPMINPYELKTKGEMITNSNLNNIRNLYELSCSCAKRGHSYYWDSVFNSKGEKKEHCGMCLPCIYRRVALHFKGLDTNVE